MAWQTMRREHIAFERPVYIAADGWAYERPRGDRVWRYPHDGGTQTMDSSARLMEAGEIPDAWPEIVAAWDEREAGRRRAADQAGY